jgi:hypothetical protein
MDIRLRWGKDISQPGLTGSLSGSGICTHRYMNQTGMNK